MDETPDSAAEHDRERPATPRRHDVEVRVRRSPKFGVFILVGAVVGALVAWVVSAVQSPGVNEAGQPVDTSGVLGLAIVVGVVLGVGVGAVVALLVDRSLAKRGRMLVAEQTDVEAEQPQAAVAPADAGEASFEHLELQDPEGDERQPGTGERAPRDDAGEAPSGDQAGERDRPSGA